MMKTTAYQSHNHRHEPTTLVLIFWKKQVLQMIVIKVLIKTNSNWEKKKSLRKVKTKLEWLVEIFMY